MFMIDKIGKVGLYFSPLNAFMTVILCCSQDSVAELAPTLATLVKNIGKRGAFLKATKRCLHHVAQKDKLVVERTKEQAGKEDQQAAITLLQRLLRGRATQVSTRRETPCGAKDMDKTYTHS